MGSDKFPGVSNGFFRSVFRNLRQEEGTKVAEERAIPISPPQIRNAKSMPVVSGSESDVREVPPSEIRGQLYKILTSQRFHNAEQLRNFLSYIAEKTREDPGGAR